MASIVYGKKPYAYVWGDNNGSHKQGKVYPEQALVVIENKGKWLLIERPELDREVDEGYSEFWIRSGDTVASHEPPIIPPSSDDDEEVAAAILVILRWLKKE